MNRSLLATCLLPLFSTAADERVILEKPVRVVTSADSSIFPKSWRKEPVLASGEVLPESHAGRVRAVLSHALAKFPHRCSGGT